MADRLNFLCLSEVNPKVSLWLGVSADRLRIQLKEINDMESELGAASHAYEELKQMMYSACDERDDLRRQLEGLGVLALDVFEATGAIESYPEATGALQAAIDNARNYTEK